MWLTTFEVTSIILCVMSCAAAVKLLDDYLDHESDIITERFNWYVSLGPGSMAYALVLLAIAAGINYSVSMPLFFASYIVGMFKDLNKRYPTRLRGYQESMVVFIISIIIFKISTMLFAISLILVIQLVDDCFDFKYDVLIGRRNLAYQMGRVACCITALLLLVIAWSINPNIFFPVVIGITVFYFIVILLQEVNKGD